MYEEISIDSRTGQKRMVIIPQTGYRRFRSRGNLGAVIITQAEGGGVGEEIGRRRKE